FGSLLASLSSLQGDDAARPALSFYRGRTRVGRLSYRGLAERVLRLAGHLHRSTTLAPGDRIAVLATNRLEGPSLVLAALAVRVAVVRLNPNGAAEDCAFILSHSGARILFAAPELVARLPETEAEVLSLTDLEPRASESPPEHVGPKGRLLARVT